jgi:hypothetical protein
MIEHNRNLWKWIMKNLDDAIDRAKNGNLTLRKFIRFHLHEDNSNIGLSDKDQEVLDKLKILDLMEKKKSTSPTLPPNPSSVIYKLEETQCRNPSCQYRLITILGLLRKDTTWCFYYFNKPNTRSRTKNVNKFDFCSLRPINSSAS